MKRTRVCDIFGIQYPIIQGGMLGISSPEFVAAVSNAGGLGLLSGVVAEKGLRAQIKRTRSLTAKPFGVNVPINSPAGVVPGGGVERLIDVLAEEGVPIVATAAGNPVPWVKRFKDKGLTVMHVAPTARLAQRAEDAGADAVVASGYEAGGYVGNDQVTTMALIPLVADLVKIPMIAAGGIADARGMAAAFALGAEGVQMGTRLIATDECPASVHFKESILAAKDTDTEVSKLAIGTARSLKTALTGDENPATEYARYAAGQIAGVVREIKSVEAVIAEMVREYGRVVERLA